MSAATEASVIVSAVIVDSFLEEEHTATSLDRLDELVKRLTDDILNKLYEWYAREAPESVEEAVERAERVIQESVERAYSGELGVLLQSIDVDGYVELQVEEFSRKVDELYNKVYQQPRQPDELLDAILRTLATLKAVYIMLLREKRLYRLARRAAATLAALTVLTRSGRHTSLVKEMPRIAERLLGEVLDELAAEV